MKIITQPNFNPNVVLKGGFTPLTLAVKSEYNIPEVQFLISQGVDVNLPIIIYSPHQCYWSPLKIAAANGNLNIMNLLIDAGANINFIDNNKYSILHTCVISNKEYSMIKLINRGANIDITDGNGDTPLMTALKCKYYSLAVKLVDYGANVNCSNNGITPLLLVTSTNSIDAADLVLFLLKNNADPNVISHDGLKTPLIWALEGNFIQSDFLFLAVVDKMLSYGADPNMKNIKDEDPMYYAIKTSNIYFVMMLLEYGAKKPEKINFSRSLFGIDIGLYQAYQQLADMTMNCYNPWSSLHFALFNPFSNNIKKLVKSGKDIRQMCGNEYMEKSVLDLVLEPINPYFQDILKISNSKRKIIRAYIGFQLALTNDQMNAHYYLAMKNRDIFYPSPGLVISLISNSVRERLRIVLLCHRFGKTEDDNYSLAYIPEDLLRQYVLPMICDFSEN